MIHPVCEVYGMDNIDPKRIMEIKDELIRMISKATGVLGKDVIIHAPPNLMHREPNEGVFCLVLWPVPPKLVMLEVEISVYLKEILPNTAVQVRVRP